MSSCNDSDPCRHSSKTKIDAKNKDKISGCKSASCDSHPFESQKTCGKTPCGESPFKDYQPRHPPLLGLPNFLRMLGEKHYEIARLHLPALAIYTLACVAAMPFFCEWKTVLKYIPVSSYRFKDDE